MDASKRKTWRSIVFIWGVIVPATTFVANANRFLNDGLAPTLRGLGSKAWAYLPFAGPRWIVIAGDGSGNLFIAKRHSSKISATEEAVNNCKLNSEARNNCYSTALGPDECFVLVKRTDLGRWSMRQLHFHSKGTSMQEAKKPALEKCRKSSILMQEKPVCILKKSNSQATHKIA